jgi:hypothetical protein
MAAAIRFGFPAREQLVPYLAWGGIACVLAYLAGQWRKSRRCSAGVRRAMARSPA